MSWTGTFCSGLPICGEREEGLCMWRTKAVLLQIGIRAEKIIVVVGIVRMISLNLWASYKMCAKKINKI